ncbi:MAG TPA: cold shock domain-containing protein [Anaerolineaceae bacterium]
MLKIMVFIDGTWLYINKSRLSEVYGDESFHVDFGKLPNVLAQEVSQQLGDVDVDIVRTCLFGSYAINFDIRDEEIVNRRREFFDMLKEEHHYEVEIYPINFRGRRIRKTDRDARDTFEPKEKYVDISLAASALYYAAIPNVYDIAIVVIGDRDFIPMLQAVRRLGKRVAIASIKNSCAPDLADPRDASRVKDFDLIWLDGLLEKLELRYERRLQHCESPIHHGNPMVWTTFRPKRGQKFFCDECRAEFQRQKREVISEFIETPEDEQAEALEGENSSENEYFSPRLTGSIKRLFPQKAFGFITGSDGKDYFFHLTDLQGVEFANLSDGDRVEFEIEKPASESKAGSAQSVRPFKEVDEDEEAEEYLEE